MPRMDVIESLRAEVVLANGRLDDKSKIICDMNNELAEITSNRDYWRKAQRRECERAIHAEDELAEIERLRAEVERLEKALNGAVKKLTRHELAKAARASRDASITGGGE